MEGMWGADPIMYSSTTANKYKDTWQSSLSFEQSYVTFDTGIGTFDVGYKSGIPYGWGTVFMNAPGTAPGVKWSNKFGNVSVLAGLAKTVKGDLLTTGKPTFRQSDADSDYYDLGATYKFKTGEAGLLLTYFRDATARSQSTTSSSMTTVYNFQPYAKAKLGPVDVEAEAYWMSGKSQSDIAGTADTDIKTKGLYLNGRFNMGPAYVGGVFIYASGDDPATTDTVEGGYNSTLTYSRDSEPWGDISNSILWGDDYQDYLTTQGDATATSPGKYIDNVWLYRIYGGYAVTKKLDLSARYSYMKADQEPTTTGYQSKNYGTELDLKATYKIYDNLTYNLGAAYLWTGDWFKGTNSSADIKNNYYLSHWINLRF
jgi:hypothetical protein